MEMVETPEQGENTEALKAEIKSLNISLKKANREIKRLEKNQEYIAALNEQAYKMRDFYEAEYKQQFLYSSLILKNSPDILFIMDLDFKILLVTDSFLHTFEKTSMDIESKLSMEDIIKDKMQPEAWRRLDERCRSLSPDSPECEEQITLDLHHEKRIFDTHAGVIFQEEFSGYVITMSDVTEVVREKERAESADRAKSDFLANMSHEIRTPMNAISGMAEFIIRDTADAEARENAQQIKSACRSLLAIINDILDFSKIEAGRMELTPVEYQISSVINDVSNMISIRLQEKPVELILEIDENMPYYLYGDEIRLRQILVNILNNAAKFTAQGFIRLKIWHELNKKKDEIKICASVQDSGIGIRKEDLKKLFSSFSQVDTKKNRSIEGTGLGLAISKRLAVMMGGDITVESEYGKGTTFTFWVIHKVLDYKPVGKLKPGDAMKGQEAFANSFTAPYAKILIVDDNLINLKVAKGMMAPYQCSLTLAAGGQEAIDIVQTSAFDLIFMDHMMPVMDGVEAMQEIRSLKGREDAVIIALTANAVSGVREKYKELGFHDFLAKPIEPEKLERLLEKYLPVQMRVPCEGKQDGKSISDLIDEDVLRQVYSDGVKKLKLFRQLLEEKDYKNYIIEVHALKSVAAAIGEPSLSEKAKSHEMAGKSGNFSFIEENFENLMESYEELVTRLEAQFGKEEGGEEETPLAISEAAKDELFEKTRKAIGDFDMLAVNELLQQLVHVELGEKTETVRKMMEAAEQFDYDALEELEKQL